MKNAIRESGNIIKQLKMTRMFIQLNECHNECIYHIIMVAIRLNVNFPHVKYEVVDLKRECLRDTAFLQLIWICVERHFGWFCWIFMKISIWNRPNDKNKAHLSFGRGIEILDKWTFICNLCMYSVVNLEFNLLIECFIFG